MLVLDIFHDAFNYRGLVPIDVEVVFGGRASEEFVYRSFAPQEIAEIAAGLRYRAQVQQSGGGADRATSLLLRKGSTVAEVVLGDPTDDSNMYSFGLRRFASSAAGGVGREWHCVEINRACARMLGDSASRWFEGG